ncbi:MAG TPA: xanthine phosphoribosyltransferase, partial [Anaerolineae bacterium]|nr:xanthine phosphoribosyltransferase [Anaerolineae bacterium]
TILALVRLAQSAGAQVIGVGAVIEKSFEGGRAKLEQMGLRVRSLAVITKMTEDEIIFAEGTSP